LKNKKVNGFSARSLTSSPRPKKLIEAICHISPLGTIELVVPILTVSEANSREHWHKQAARHQKQKQLIKVYMLPVRSKLTLPCRVHITRLAPRKLDKRDNLPMSLKYVVDSLCEEMTGDYTPGRADSDDRIDVIYSQETSKEYGIRIKFECALASEASFA
jgi:hypothetical protein